MESFASHLARGTKTILIRLNKKRRRKKPNGCSDGSICVEENARSTWQCHLASGTTTMQMSSRFGRIKKGRNQLVDLVLNVCRSKTMVASASKKMPVPVMRTSTNSRLGNLKDRAKKKSLNCKANKSDHSKTAMTARTR